MDKRIGKIVFLIGVIIAVLAGLAGDAIGLSGGIVTGLLIIAGLIVGFLNVNHKETHGFLVASIALILIGATDVPELMEVLPGIGSFLSAILTNLTIFIAPAALVVALKIGYSIAQD